MSRQNTSNTAKKTVTVRRRKSHRVAVFLLSAFLMVCILGAMICLLSLAEIGWGSSLFFCIAALIPFLPLPVYYATWRITFAPDGIRRCLFWFDQKCRPWTQVNEVRAIWLTSERCQVVSIRFKDGKTIHFRMDCDNAERARKLILSHCSITE